MILAGHADFQTPRTPEGRVIIISEKAISTFSKPVNNGQNDFILQYVVALGEGSSPPGFRTHPVIVSGFTPYVNKTHFSLFLDP